LTADKNFGKAVWLFLLQKQKRCNPTAQANTVAPHLLLPKRTFPLRGQFPVNINV